MAVKKREPERSCVICRRKFPKKQLKRHVLGEDGKLVFDQAAILPGRGWYLCANAECERKFRAYAPKRRAARKARL